MAHAGEKITARIVILDDLFQDHSNEGTEIRGEQSAVSERGKWWVAIRDSEASGPFHLRPVSTFVLDSVRHFRFHDEEPHGALYRPLHPDMTAEDIEGATYAYDDGTHWLFAHCSPAEQLDFAAEARTFVFNQFQPALIKANTALGRGGVDAAANSDRVRALTDFAEQAANKAFDIVRFATLGHYHRDPHRDHKRELAVASMDAVTKAWGENAGRVADRARVQNTVVILREQLTREYDIQWRHEWARDQAAIGADPIDGREHCYTLAAVADAITGDANLPDPDWNFDAFGQGVARGAYTYYDREPATTDLLPFVIRFHRPVPTPTPAPGASMGTVEWVQDAAYRAG